MQDFNSHMEWTFEQIALGFGVLETSNSPPDPESLTKENKIFIQQQLFRRDRGLQIQESNLNATVPPSQKPLSPKHSIVPDPREIFSRNSIASDRQSTYSTYSEKLSSDPNTNIAMQNPLYVFAEEETFLGSRKATLNAQRKYKLHYGGPCLWVIVAPRHSALFEARLATELSSANLAHTGDSHENLGFIPYIQLLDSWGLSFSTYTQWANETIHLDYGVYHFMYAAGDCIYQFNDYSDAPWTAGPGYTFYEREGVNCQQHCESEDKTAELGPERPLLARTQPGRDAKAASAKNARLGDKETVQTPRSRSKTKVGATKLQEKPSATAENTSDDHRHDEKLHEGNLTNPNLGLHPGTQTDKEVSFDSGLETMAVTNAAHQASYRNMASGSGDAVLTGLEPYTISDGTPEKDNNDLLIQRVVRADQSLWIRDQSLTHIVQLEKLLSFMAEFGDTVVWPSGQKLGADLCIYNLQAFHPERPVGARAGWLNETAVFEALTALCNGHEEYQALDPLVVSKAFGEDDISLLRIHDDTEVLMVPFHDKDHWFLIVVDLQRNSITTFDITPREMEALFFRKIFDVSTDVSIHHISVVDNDGASCGVIMLRQAEEMLSGTKISISLLDLRLRYLNNILKSSLDQISALSLLLKETSEMDIPTMPKSSVCGFPRRVSKEKNGDSLAPTIEDLVDAVACPGVIFDLISFMKACRTEQNMRQNGVQLTIQFWLSWYWRQSQHTLHSQMVGLYIHYRHEQLVEIVRARLRRRRLRKRRSSRLGEDTSSGSERVGVTADTYAMDAMVREALGIEDERPIGSSHDESKTRHYLSELNRLGKKVSRIDKWCQHLWLLFPIRNVAVNGTTVQNKHYWEILNGSKLKPFMESMTARRKKLLMVFPAIRAGLAAVIRGEHLECELEDWSLEDIEAQSLDSDALLGGLHFRPVALST